MRSLFVLLTIVASVSIHAQPTCEQVASAQNERELRQIVAGASRWISESRIGQAIGRYVTSRGNIKKIVCQGLKGVSPKDCKKNIKKYKLKEGDCLVLDRLHFDHLEIYDARGMIKKVIDLEGNIIPEKTDKALRDNRIESGCK